MRRAWALLALLTTLNILSWIDRQIVAGLAPLVIADLGLTNAQIGLLYGYAFIVCFVLAGMFLGQLADRVHRLRLIAAGLAAWSASTAASGLARTFAQLAGARVFVGIGEATLTPAALAVLSHAFPAEWRARAAGVFATGLPLGSGLSLVIAGLVAPRYGWRTCFFVLGAAGVIAAAAVSMMADVRAPARQAPGGAATDRGDRPMRELLATLRRSPALLCTIAGGIIVTFSTAATVHVITWLVRERGFEFRRAAILAGGLYAVAGTAGNVAGGWIADWCEARWRNGRLWSLVGAQAVLGPPTLVFFLAAPGSTAFYAGWVLSSLRGTIWYGPLYAATQDLAPPASRATAIAFLMLAINLLGAGPGPWIAGAIGDASSLTAGLVTTTLAGLLSIVPFALAARSQPLPSEAADPPIDPARRAR
jgi:MFS family permease